MTTRVPRTLDQVIAEADALKAAGRPRDAAARYEAWVHTDTTPARCVALFNLGVLRSDLGELAAADAAYQEALAINPQFHQARINLGLSAERQGRESDAARHWLSVAEAVSAGHLDAVPFATIALNHLGRLQESKRHYAAAESALAHSLQIDAAQPDAIQHWVHLRQKQCTWPVYAPLPGVSVNRLLAATSPLAMLAMLDDPAMQWLAASSFVQRKYGSLSLQAAGTTWPDGRHATPRPQARAADTGDPRLHIGYLSGDLCTHAVGLLMADLLEAHDRAAVHITAFDFSPEDGTAHRARLRRACDDMVPIHTLSDAAAAHAVRGRGIDVLIDMHGLSSGARPGILAERPAPLMGAYLGFIGTTTFPWLDFFVTDRWTTPEVMAPYLTEQVLYVDGPLIPLAHQPVGPRRFSRADVGLPADGVVLACFNNIYKITPSVFAGWLRIMRRVPNAVLWLLDDNTWATSALRAHAVAAGVETSRIIFAGRSTHAEYREKLTLVDVYLDTFPYNAGSTARDVLDAHTLLVTLAGRTSVSRMAGGLLHAAGFDDLIAATQSDYEDLVVALASDGERRLAVKARMREQADEWKAAPRRMVRSLEAQLRVMLREVTGRVPPADRR